MESLVVQSQLARYQSLADGSLRLVFDCGEEGPDTLKIVGGVNKKVGVLVFKADQETLSPKEKEAIENFKVSGMAKIDPRSKSQKLRATLFHYYEKQQEIGSEEIASFQTFEQFYAHKMNTIISYYERELKDN